MNTTPTAAVGEVESQVLLNLLSDLAAIGNESTRALHVVKIRDASSRLDKAIDELDRRAADGDDTARYRAESLRSTRSAVASIDALDVGLLTPARRGVYTASKERGVITIYESLDKIDVPITSLKGWAYVHRRALRFTSAMLAVASLCSIEVLRSTGVIVATVFAMLCLASIMLLSDEVMIHDMGEPELVKAVKANRDRTARREVARITSAQLRNLGVETPSAEALNHRGMVDILLDINDAGSAIKDDDVIAHFRQRMAAFSPDSVLSDDEAKALLYRQRKGLINNTKENS